MPDGPKSRARLNRGASFQAIRTIGAAGVHPAAYTTAASAEGVYAAAKDLDAVIQQQQQSLVWQFIVQQQFNEIDSVSESCQQQSQPATEETGAAKTV